MSYRRGLVRALVFGMFRFAAFGWLKGGTRQTAAPLFGAHASSCFSIS
jgi:hypothetical protein